MIVQPKKLLFEQIADYFRQMISKGAYKPGQALPSVREVALQEGVNPNTVAKAYGLLDNEGLIYAIPKKGYFVSKSIEDKDEITETIKFLLEKGHSLRDIEEVVNRLKGGKDD